MTQSGCTRIIAHALEDGQTYMYTVGDALTVPNAGAKVAEMNWK